jgi:hypothetical protein
VRQPAQIATNLSDEHGDRQSAVEASIERTAGYGEAVLTSITRETLRKGDEAALKFFFL